MKINKSLLLSILLFLTSFLSIKAYSKDLSKTILGLNRVLSFELNGEKRSFAFTKLSYDWNSRKETAYFMEPLEETYLRLQYVKEEKIFNASILDTYKESVINFEITENPLKDKIFNTKTYLVNLKHSSEYYENNTDYWVDYNELEAMPLQGQIKLTSHFLTTDSKKQIGATQTLTGSMSFSECDGCEHGDQIMLFDSSRNQSINVVALDFGSYYKWDCGGTLHPWLSSLVSRWRNEGLKAPFTYVGKVTSLTSDLWEDVFDFWTALEGQGKIFLGYSQKLPINKYFDSMIYRTAFKLGQEPLVIWNDVLEKGSFTKLENDVLYFEYEGLIISTNLRTATIK